MATSLRRDRVGYLDGIRAIAIGTVLVVHWVGSQFPVALGGYIGVDIFFVLSGYIITTMLWKSRSEVGIGRQYGRFMKRRFVRLYPALIGLVAGTTVIYAVFPHAPQSVSDLAGQGMLALVQGFSIYNALGGAHGSAFAVTWSLAVEWMFYLLWPVAVYAAKRAGAKPRTVAKWTIVVSILVYLLALLQNEHWFYYGPVARVPEILAGGALALLLVDSSFVGRPLRNAKLANWLALVAVAAIAAYTILGPVQWSPLFRFVGLPVTVSAALYLIWLGVRSPASGAIRMLGWGPLTFVGRISYSLYLWHSIGVNLFTRENIHLPLPVVALIAIALAAVMTGISYRFLERPFTKSQGSALRTTAPADKQKLGADVA